MQGSEVPAHYFTHFLVKMIFHHFHQSPSFLLIWEILIQLQCTHTSILMKMMENSGTLNASLSSLIMSIILIVEFSLQNDEKLNLVFSYIYLPWYFSLFYLNFEALHYCSQIFSWKWKVNRHYAKRQYFKIPSLTHYLKENYFHTSNIHRPWVKLF